VTGLKLSGGPGGPGSVAVPVPSGEPQPRPASRPVVRELSAPAGRPPARECAEETVKPKVLTSAQPDYPDAARAAAIEGRVRVEARIAADGSIGEVRVLEGLGHGLDEAAIAAVRRWTFSPATACGQPVAATFTARLTFRL
jgi:protein TonB